GKKLFVVGELPRAQLHRFNYKSNQFEPHLDGISATGMVFSPDGQWIAWTSYPQSAMWRSRLDGSQRVQLTPDSDLVALPRWSPDGKNIVFVKAGETRGGSIQQISADGGDSRVLYSTQNYLDRPSWAEKGRAIIFGEWQAGDDAHESTHILHLDSRSVTRLP